MYCNTLLYLVVVQVLMGFVPVESSNDFSRIPIHNLSEEPLPKPEKQRSSLALQELVKTNSDAYTLWNLTHKYGTYNPNKTRDTCTWEFQRNRELIPAYMLNITFEMTEKFLEEHVAREFKHYSGNEMKFARKLHESRTKIINDMKKYLSISKNVFRHKGETGDNKKITCISSSICGCVRTSYLRTFEAQLQDFKEDTENLWDFIVLGSYVEPIFRTIIFFAGLALNGALLYTFYKEEIVRTESNVLILNLAISNILMILFYIPTNYVRLFHLHEYGNHKNRWFTGVEILVISANTFTVLFLNIQRYFDVCRVLDKDNVKCKLTPTWRCIAYLASLWLWCLLVSLIFGLMNPYLAQKLKAFLYFLIYLFFFSMALAVFNSMTARKLQQSAKQGNTVSEIKQIAGSGVILSLTAIFYVTHLPFFISSTYENLIDWIAMDFYSSLMTRIIVFIIHAMFLLYPCVNVMILHKASGTYRYFLNQYIFRCWYNPQERQYITMSSVPSVESRG